MKNHSTHSYKYLHFFWNGDAPFFYRFYEMIKNSEIFNNDEHFFIVLLQNKPLVKRKNVQYVKKITFWDLIIFGKKANFVFIHGFDLPFYEIAFLPDSLIKKVVWRTWGHDIPKMNDNSGDMLKKTIKKSLYKLYFNKVKKIKYIAIENDIDKYNVIESIGNHNFIKLNYSYIPNQMEMIEKIKNKHTTSTSTRIMIGHSGFENDYHIEALECLKKYRNENVTICLNLAYGDAKYIETVIEKAKEIFGNKVEVFETKRNYQDYLLYLNSINVCVFNQKQSTALDTLSIMLFLEKPIFFRDDGIFAKTFRKMNISYNSINDFGEKGIESVKKAKNDHLLKESFCNIKDEREICSIFGNVLKVLNEK